MALTTSETNQVRVDVLGVSVDESTTWTTGGPAGGRNALDAGISERVVTRLLNDIYARLGAAVGSTNGFADLFATVVGDATGADQAAFDALGMNLIQAITVGAGGGGRFEYEQTVADTTWTVPHNLNQRLVAVQVIDGVGNTLLGDIDYDTVNRCILTFSRAVAGTAIIRT